MSKRCQHKAKNQGLHQTTTSGVCRVCGCTDENACIDAFGDPCVWADETHTICTECYGRAKI